MRHQLGRRLSHIATAATLSMSWLAFTATPTLAAPTFKLPLECGSTGGAYEGTTHSGHGPNEIDFNQGFDSQGNDLDRGDEVLASAAGTFVVLDPDADPPNGEYAIDHGDGWFTIYAHMDPIHATPGETVEVGELIGQISHKGLAPDQAHLHYQQVWNGDTQPPTFDGAAYNYGSISSTLCLNPPFTDHFDSWVRNEINWLYANGISLGCDTIRYCPEPNVPRAEMAVFFARYFNLPTTGTDYFWDDNGRPEEWAINRIAAAGISNGCGGGAFCPDQILLREQIATMLARKLVGLPANPPDAYWDDNGNYHEPNINKLAAVGITVGCGGGAYCPAGPVTREQMAAFLYRGRDYRP